MELTIKPLDTLFFRDGKPFARGEETWADSTFPPSPSVIYGALRTALATISGKEIPFKEISSRLGLETLSISNIYFRINERNYFMLPQDLVEYKTRKAQRTGSKCFHDVSLLDISEMNSIVSDNKSFIKYQLHPKENKIAENLENGLLYTNDLMSYLNGKIRDFNAYKLNDFIVEEPKVGIGRDNHTRTAEEGLLYRVDMKRLSGVELRITIRTNYNDSDIGGLLVNLGGEKKVVQINIVDKETVVNIPRPTLNRGGFKIYLSTPSIFIKKGWQPDLERFGIRANLVTACVGKPLNIGGFDLVKNCPKPMVKAVPPGSVYYYETDEEPDKIVERLHDKSLSDYLPEQGYGIAFIGNVNLK